MSTGNNLFPTRLKYFNGSHALLQFYYNRTLFRVAFLLLKKRHFQIKDIYCDKEKIVKEIVYELVKRQYSFVVKFLYFIKYKK